MVAMTRLRGVEARVHLTANRIRDARARECLGRVARPTPQEARHGPRWRWTYLRLIAVVGEREQSTESLAKARPFESSSAKIGGVMRSRRSLLVNVPPRHQADRFLPARRQRHPRMHTRVVIALVLVLSVLTGVVQAAGPSIPDPSTVDRTPPRLSFVDGQVSFWRPGAQDWAQAQMNTPLAPGDELATASPGNLEVQIGARAFVRTWANTQVGLANQEPDFLQFKVTTGTASFDLRTIEPGHTVEVDTPNAAFTIERAGYYRVDVSGERTALIIRRGGRATMTPASGAATVIAPSEEVVIEGTSSPQVASYASPPLDAWDRWNYARTDHLLDAVSARYVSPEAYGVSELDRYGTWRVVPTYGSVWVPTAVPTAWAPYSTGSWTLDPFYGWTWVDTAPWGWAPYHYGRWVFVDGFWGWAPGPVLVRPVYAPALVAFFGGPSASVSVSIGGPVVGWVALGWGEPVVPWWGPAGFIHEPSWRGWGGPRVVNNTVINNTTVVNVQNINVYRNTNVQNAVVAVNEQHFGHGPITPARVAATDVKNLQPTHTAPQITASPASFVPTASRGVRPPEGSLQRSVVATRPPRAGSDTAAAGQRQVGPAGVSRPAPRLVSMPAPRESVPVPARPAFGQSTVERSTEDRAHPPSPPGAPKLRASLPQPRGQAQGTAPTPATPQSSPPARAAAPPLSAGHREPATVTAPTPTAPQTSASRPTVPPPPGRRPEPSAVTAPAPAAPQPSPSRVAAPRSPAGRHEAPQVTAPAPTAPPPSPSRVAAPPLTARRPEAPQAPASASAGPQSAPSRVTGPPPAAPHPSPPQVAAPVAPQPPAHRAETPRSPTRPLPGEPANRLAPNRGPDASR